MTETKIITYLRAVGKISTFGGPHDKGVSVTEGLALLSAKDIYHPVFSKFFLSYQPLGTSGIARRLNPQTHYLAMRWDYKTTPRSWLRENKVLVRAKGKVIEAQPLDWGPHERTGRIADLSPGLAAALGLRTDDVVIVEVPLPK